MESNPPSVFLPLLKRSSYDPYLKILDLAKLFVTDAPMKKKSKIFVLPPLRANIGLKTGHG